MSATPVTPADLQVILDRIHRVCDLGPYQLKASSATIAVITIPATMRVDPLSRTKHRCVEAQIARVAGVTLGRGVVPTVD